MLERKMNASKRASETEGKTVSDALFYVLCMYKKEKPEF
jgi:hypothetical protein